MFCLWTWYILQLTFFQILVVHLKSWYHFCKVSFGIPLLTVFSQNIYKHLYKNEGNVVFHLKKKNQKKPSLTLQKKNLYRTYWNNRYIAQQTWNLYNFKLWVKVLNKSVVNKRVFRISNMASRCIINPILLFISYFIL